MTSVRGPRRNSSAYNALERLYQLGGKAVRSQLVAAVLSHFRSETRFSQLVIEPLEKYKFIKIHVDDIVITAAGGDFIAGQSDAVVPTPGPIAGYIDRSFRGPLDLSKYCAHFEIRRPGALEYREIPSVMGAARVPFRAVAAG